MTVKRIAGEYGFLRNNIYKILSHYVMFITILSKGLQTSILCDNIRL